MEETRSIRADWTPASGSLVPHKDAPGTDIFFISKGYFIVRSDLGCYLRTDDLNKGKNIKIERLHPACQGGDHYLGDIHDPPNIYIIKGNSYRVVKDLSTDAGAQVHDLHPNHCNGDEYLRCFSAFYIIFLEQEKVHKVSNLTQPHYEVLTLPPQWKTGLYFFSHGLDVVLIKVDEKWGPQMYHYLEPNYEQVGYYSMHPDVLNFLPGGLIFTQGDSVAGWECIKTLYNSSDSSITWTGKVTHKVGYAKHRMSTIEHNWNISPEMSIGAGELTRLITQLQFSFKAQYGGKSVLTEQEDWNEAQEKEESLSVTLEPKKNLYIWQYRLGMGQEPVLFCRDVEFTKENHPPEHIPLPPVP
ncbi:uncharacterized protein LOC142004788 [Carettochelys insculpta]|uniref:uncharacterized protein LOC142004788 n=1 Tax=Carettochelys insculpta TaxID=44489 RepID=UPI003EBC71CF